MSEPLWSLYNSRVYPPMSHPVSDPAVSSVAALLGGLDTAAPSKARILEIGCGQGLNLLPLAARWPASKCTGIDWSESAIAAARELASAGDVSNVEFHALDLRDFDPAPEAYDFIIAHGVFSWVPDDVKSALFRTCRKGLSPTGLATISFNVEAGWLPRFPVIAKAKAIMEAGASDEIQALGILRSVVVDDSRELEIIDDMLAKGAAILPFDDFAPVNDPWPVDRFVREAMKAGLRWLGESNPAANLPIGVDAAVVERLFQDGTDPLAAQAALDEVAVRTFRSGVLCRADAHLETRFSLGRILNLSVRCGSGPERTDIDRWLYDAVQAFAPECVPLTEIAAELANTPKVIARAAYEGIQTGMLFPRIEPVRFSSDPPARPALNGLRLQCARRKLPIVDAWHQPCSFPHSHYEVLAAMDGTRDRSQLAQVASVDCPELAFDPWLRHLSGRGFFA